MPPLPTVRSASTAEPFAHHVGRTCHQGQNPKNHNRKASACLPIFFLFCLPFVCPSFALLLAPFSFTIAKKPLFSMVTIMFLFALLFARSSLRKHLGTLLRTISKPGAKPVLCWSFRWSVADMLAFQSVTAQDFPLVARWSFRWSLVCCSFVVLFVSHRPACTSTRYGIRLLERILFVILFVGHSFCHAKYPTCVTNIQPCGSYGGQSYRQPQILFAQIRPYFALYVIFIFAPIFIANCLYL